MLWQVPPCRQTSLPGPPPCLAMGRSLPARSGGAASGGLAGFAMVWKSCRGSAQPDEHVHKGCPRYGAYVKEDLAVKVVPWVLGASSWLCLRETS